MPLRAQEKPAARHRSRALSRRTKLRPRADFLEAAAYYEQRYYTPLAETMPAKVRLAAGRGGPLRWRSLCPHHVANYGIANALIAARTLGAPSVSKPLGRTSCH